jgi:hypothetical protein
MKDFKVHILGVLKNVQAPQRNLILRARGRPAAETGVIAGMSGSPVYIDGALIGASLFIGAFPKEPIAGITPIGEMIEATEPAARAAPPPRAGSNCHPERRRRRDPRELRARREFRRSPADVQGSAARVAGSQMGALCARSPPLMSERHDRRRRSGRVDVPRRGLHADAFRRSGRGDARLTRIRSSPAIRSASRSSAATARWAPPAR